MKGFIIHRYPLFEKPMVLNLWRLKFGLQILLLVLTPTFILTSNLVGSSQLCKRLRVIALFKRIKKCDPSVKFENPLNSIIFSAIVLYAIIRVIKCIQFLTIFSCFITGNHRWPLQKNVARFSWWIPVEPYQSIAISIAFIRQ